MRDYRRLRVLLRNSRSAIVLGHQNGDPDAVCSAFALSGLLRRLRRRIAVEVSFPEGVSRISSEILRRIPLTINPRPRISDFDLIFTVDISTLQQLGDWKGDVEGSGRPIVMIDHHAPHPESQRIASLMICDEEATSTCEVIYGMYRRLGFKPNREEALALLIGLLHETAHLSLGTSRSFNNACQLIGLGIKPEDALSLMRLPMDRSERIARLKSAQRLRLERVGGWLIAMSNVDSFQASAARALIGLGAHLAVVVGGEKGKLTLSLRSTKEFHEGTAIHLGRDLAQPIGEQMGGAGGGHATAAGADVEGDPEEALRRCLLLIKQRLGRVGPLRD